MEFFEAVHKRRSVREYSNKPVPRDVMIKAFEAAQLSPNSSNMQTWGFYWVKSDDKKTKLVEACLNQNSAKTAQELVVAVAHRGMWKQNAKEMARRLKEQGADEKVILYYDKLMPFTYGLSFLAPIKWLIFNGLGLFRPMIRRPYSSRDVDEVCIKSTALACENFMLAVSAQNFDTCPMEGFDESRVKKILGLKCSSRVVMVISVGERVEKGIWGKQIRFPFDTFMKEV